MRTFAVIGSSDSAELADFAGASPFCHPTPEIDLYFLQDRTLEAAVRQPGNRAGEFANQLSDQDAQRNLNCVNRLKN
jgi:hypothetical protein